MKNAIKNIYCAKFHELTCLRSDKIIDLFDSPDMQFPHNTCYAKLN